MPSITTDAELARNVAKVLREAAGLRNTAFQYKNFVVTGIRYGVIADLVDAGRIACSVGTPSSANLPGGSRAVAEYVASPGSRGGHAPDQFILPRSNFGEFIGNERMTIVHEAAHAIHDVFLAMPCLAIEDEATAWLAQAFYLRTSNSSFSLGGLQVNGPLDLALKLADRIMARNPAGLTATVHEAEIMPLKAAVAIDYGFLAGAAGILSVYDGVP